MSKIIWGDKKEVSLEAEPQEGGTVIGHFGHKQFLFYFILFFLILYRFSFSFLFLLDDEEVYDMEVT